MSALAAQPGKCRSKQSDPQFSGRYTTTSINRRNLLKIKHGGNFRPIQNGPPAEGFLRVRLLFSQLCFGDGGYATLKFRWLEPCDSLLARRDLREFQAEGAEG